MLDPGQGVGTAILLRKEGICLRVAGEGFRLRVKLKISSQVVGNIA